MRKKVQMMLKENHMFPKGAEIVVGISGGADSVALLHILNGWREREGWTLTAVHVHHGLRGAAADEDQAFVERLCADWGVPCKIYRYDVAAEAKKRGRGEEETGRHLRYAAFRETAGERGYIAVAHHQNDQAETLLMRLCRGTGLNGLTGMRPVRGNICRPLLACSRAEIERYCLAEGLAFREDESNREVKYIRNKLRHEVLPLMEEINPRAVVHIARTAALLADDEEYLEQQAAALFAALERPACKEAVSLEREGLLRAHPAMRRRVLRLAMGRFVSADVSHVQIAALEELLQKPTGKSRCFLQGIRAENSYGMLLLSKAAAERASSFCYALPQEGEIFIPEIGATVSICLRVEKNGEICGSGCTNVFDYDKILGRISGREGTEGLTCRTRRAGDSIRLKNGRKKIKDLWIDEKIPREQREAWPLVAAGEEILWVPGLRASAGFLADGQTTRFLQIRIRRDTET